MQMPFQGLVDDKFPHNPLRLPRSGRSRREEKPRWRINFSGGWSARREKTRNGRAEEEAAEGGFEKNPAVHYFIKLSPSLP